MTGRLLAGAALTLLVAQACSSAPDEGHSLDLGVSPGTVGLLCGLDGPKTIGDRIVSLEVDRTVTVLAVGLADADGLEVVDAVIFEPEAGATSRGVVAHEWPPTDTPNGWASRQSAVDYEIAPGADPDLWVGLEAPTGNGSAEAIEVMYLVEGDDRRQVQRTVDEVVIESGGNCD